MDKWKAVGDHRSRQSKFYLECLKSLKRRDRGWTVLIDSDEYLLPNYYVDKVIRANKTSEKGNETSIDIPLILHDLDRLLHYIPNTTQFSLIYPPCIPIHRVQFASKESSDEKVQRIVPPEFNGEDFQTMRWRKFGFFEEWFDSYWNATCGIVRQLPNKVVINLRRLTLTDLDRETNSGNCHRPLNICPSSIYGSIKNTFLAAHHYLGTPEQYFYRKSDKRGIGYRRARYEDVNQRFGGAETDVIRDWLQEFVQNVGTVEAAKLLEGVGKLQQFTGMNSDNHPRYNIDESDKNRSIYEIGDIVNVDFAGSGKWEPGQIYAAYSNNYYSVFFRDCSQEIATFAGRMKPYNITNPQIFII